MATKKKASRRAGGSALAKSTAEMRKELAQRRQQQGSIVGSGTGNFISTKGNVLTYRGNTLETPLAVVVLAWAQDLVYFDSPYREDDPKPPACAALQRVALADLTPLGDVPSQQSDDCASCWANEWGSDPQGGRGKACSNRYRVAVLPASDPTHDLALVRVSPSGYAGFETFINRVEAKSQEGVPAWVVGMSLRGGTDYPVVEFHEEALIDDDEMLGAVLQRIEEAEALVVQSTYDFTQYTPPKAAARTKKKAARRR